MPSNSSTKFTINPSYQLLNVNLIKCSLSFEKNEPNSSHPSPLSLNFEIKIGTSYTKITDNQFVVALQIIITGISDNQKLLNSEVIYNGLFEYNPENPQPPLDIFIHQNAPALLYSYTRPFISNLMEQAGIYPFHLPILMVIANTSSEK